jgi:glycerophosphoryl diester phosphodiesterase
MTKRTPIVQKPWVIAHRGARDEAPENTLTAFERALAYPVDGIEMDVQMSADGILVLHHDPTLHRISGRRNRIADLGFRQLQELDWGVWFDSDFKGETVPLLDQVLEDFGSRTRLMIEIKVQPADWKSGRIQSIIDKVMRLLANRANTLSIDNIFILSFDSEVLQSAYRIAPQWRYVLNLNEKNPEVISAESSDAWGWLWAIDARINRLSKPLVRWAKDRRLKMFTYTCNSPRQVKKAIQLGVDAIISDRPGWLTRHLMAGREMTSESPPSGQAFSK